MTISSYQDLLTFRVSGSTRGTLSTGPGTCVAHVVPCVQWPFIIPDGLTVVLPWINDGWDSLRIRGLVFPVESLLHACPGCPWVKFVTWFSLEGRVPFFRRLPVELLLM